jgi:hypothetical protein
MLRAACSSDHDLVLLEIMTILFMFLTQIGISQHLPLSKAEGTGCTHEARNNKDNTPKRSIGEWHLLRLPVVTTYLDFPAGVGTRNL